MVDTIIELTDDEKLRLAYDKRMHVVKNIVLDADQLYALSLLTLNNAVEPSDYPALKASIEGITGVQNIALLVDHHTLASLPTDTELRATISIDLDIVDIPQE